MRSNKDTIWWLELWAHPGRISKETLRLTDSRQGHKIIQLTVADLLEPFRPYPDRSAVNSVIAFSLRGILHPLTPRRERVSKTSSFKIECAREGVKANRHRVPYPRPYPFSPRGSSSLPRAPRGPGGGTDLAKLKCMTNRRKHPF